MADYSVWGGSYGTDPLNVAKGLVGSSLSDYYFARTGQSTYTLCVCSDFDATTLTGRDCKVYSIYYDNVGGYGYHLSVTTVDSCSFANPSGYVAFSSETGFPEIREGGVFYAQAIAVAIIVCFFFALVCRIFRHVS